MTEEEDIYDRKSLDIFGTNFGAIPCFRNTFLYGTGAGFAGGLAYFMFTSKTRIACHVGYGTFFFTSIFYWIRCRYLFAESKFSMMQIQEAYRQHRLMEGTAADK